MDLFQFLEKEFPEGCSFTTSQELGRKDKLEFDWLPESQQEFTAIIEKAPYDVLLGFGFMKWDTMNHCIAENQRQPKKQTVSMPIINQPGEEYKIEFDNSANPTELLPVDEDIILFPERWLDIIPDNLPVTGLFGEKVIFKIKHKKRYMWGSADGFAAIGITRKII